MFGILDIPDQVKHFHRVHLILHHFSVSVKDVQPGTYLSAYSACFHSDRESSALPTMMIDVRTNHVTSATFDAGHCSHPRNYIHQNKVVLRETSSMTSSSSSSSDSALRTLALVSNTTGLLFRPEKSMVRYCHGEYPKLQFLEDVSTYRMQLVSSLSPQLKPALPRRAAGAQSSLHPCLFFPSQQPPKLLQ